VSADPPPPTPEQNRALLLRFFDEVWTEGRRESIKELFAKTGVLHDGANHDRGPAEFTHFYDIMRAQFSEFSFKPIVSLGEGELVCVHWSCRCVHVFARTPVSITGISIARIKDGQTTEGWQNWDAASMTTQVPGLSLPYLPSNLRATIFLFCSGFLGKLSYHSGRRAALRVSTLERDL
jgi:predicted SnoaL-like aldol condensation-catalyzing enzyme